MIKKISGNPTIVSLVLLFFMAVSWYFGVWDTGWSDKGKALSFLGTLVVGVWAIYLFLLHGSFETSLAIDLSVETQPRDGQYVAFLQVKLDNIGGRRITAPPALSQAQIADYEESVKFPCDLQVLGLTGVTSTPRFVGWWSKKKDLLSEISGIPQHISVLYEYTRSDQQVDFFMEPGEKYVLGHVFILPAGHFVAKLVFVGERATAAEYWSRIFYFCVPAENQSVRRISSQKAGAHEK